MDSKKELPRAGDTEVSVGWRHSIKTKSLLAIALIMAVIIGFSDQLELRRNAIERAAQLDARAAVAANIQAEALQQPVWDLANEQVAAMLRALARDPDFLSAEVIGADHKQLAAFGNLNADTYFIERRAEIVHVEEGKRQSLGSLVLRLSTTNLEAASHAELQSSMIKIAVTNLIIFAVMEVALRLIIAPLRRMTEVMNRLAQGDNDVEIPATNRRDEIGTMARAVGVFKINALARARLEQAGTEQRAVTDEIRVRQAAEAAATMDAATLVVGSISQGLERLAAGDLTFRLNTALPPAYEKLRTDLNLAMGQLQASLLSIVTNTAAIRAGTGEFTQASDDLSRRTEQQAASLEQTAAALHEITSRVGKTANGAKQAIQVVIKAEADVAKSSQIVQDAVSAMNEIETSSTQISQIIGVIDEIAFQTNLLALNAGVEAARAGDAGRGFAVVATEVRALAQRSAQAAKEIKALISTSSLHVGRGVALVGETGKSLARIVSQVNEINIVFGVIAESAQEQAVGLAEVNTAINQMDQVTQQNAAMVEESTAASHALSYETEELSRLTSRFQLGQDCKPVASLREAQPARRPAGLTQRPTKTPVLKVVSQRGAAIYK